MESVINTKDKIFAVIVVAAPGVLTLLGALDALIRHYCCQCR